jgi:hypothetical protein
MLDLQPAIEESAIALKGNRAALPSKRLLRDPIASPGFPARGRILRQVFHEGSDEAVCVLYVHGDLLFEESILRVATGAEEAASRFGVPAWDRWTPPGAREGKRLTEPCQ